MSKGKKLKPIKIIYSVRGSTIITDGEQFYKDYGVEKIARKVNELIEKVNKLIEKQND